MADWRRELKKGLDTWFKIVGYCGAAWIFLDFIKYLPPEIADKVVTMVLSKLGL